MTFTLGLAIVVSLALSALAAVTAAATGATALMPAGRVHRLVEADQRGAVALDTLVGRRSRLRGASATLSAIAAGMASVTLTFALRTWFDVIPLWAAAVLGGFVGSLIAFSIAQALPRAFAVANPERVALEFAPIALPIVQVVSPVARAFSAPWKWAVGVVASEPIPSPWATGDEYWEAAASDEEQERAETEEALLEAVTEFGEKVVREVMVPRTDMAAISDDSSVADAVSLVRSTGYSRLPVFHETVDDIRGVLYAKDLLAAYERGRVDIARIARRPFFIPETKPLDQLLFEMRSTRTHIAIVADEYGGTAGLVTIEDLLEEIVGEIFDEYDLEVSMIDDLRDGVVRVDARLPVDDLNERFGTGIEFEAADTVGGLFTALAGRIPEIGDHVDVEGLRLTVDGLEGNRILHITVQSAPAPIEEGHEDA